MGQHRLYFCPQRFHRRFQQLASGTVFSALTTAQQTAYLAWKNAPLLGNFHLVLDIPAIGIVMLITFLIYRGIKETRNASNIMVAIKLIIVLMVIAIGIFYVQADNWNPFLPNGITGVLSGFPLFSLPTLALMPSPPLRRSAKILNGIFREASCIQS
jgi:amino acid transporter